VSVLRESRTFLGSRKKFWLFPLFILIVLFATILLLSRDTPIAPFIYKVF
jgi:hypothetical protein